MKNKYIFAFSVFVVALSVYLNRQQIISSIFSPRSDALISKNKIAPSNQQSASNSSPVIIASNLSVPWEIAFLPTGEILATERSGRLLKITKESKAIKVIESVRSRGEGGLLGLALHPNFAKNNYLYLYYTTIINSEVQNTLERFKLQDDTLVERKVILSNIKGSNNHDGGRIAFGPDGYLYIATGDAEVPDLAQDKSSLNGKILKVDEDGKIPADNPFGNEVYSLGLRNPQGLAWDKEGNLWVSDHGPSGLQTGNDEINLVTKGGNFGWPIIRGSQSAPGLIQPVLESGKQDTWAPSGMAYYDGSLYFAGLRGSALYKAKIVEGNKLELKEYFKKEYGRIRAVVLGPDNFLYITTSNTDGRGTPQPGDDKIIRIDPQTLN